uniref:Strawberry notch AAA domain-containing protein n=1 Tax=Glycine max TaxID=3847 RepID=K7L8C1_SOYBN
MMFGCVLSCHASSSISGAIIRPDVGRPMELPSGGPLGNCEDWSSALLPAPLHSFCRGSSLFGCAPNCDAPSSISIIIVLTDVGEAIKLPSESISSSDEPVPLLLRHCPSNNTMSSPMYLEEISTPHSYLNSSSTFSNFAGFVSLPTQASPSLFFISDETSRCIECHKAKNLVPESGSQPTRTGEAVVDIQDRLPEARVVYCSATGASEPRNMGYMVRLGLWGDGTSFTDFREFLGALDRGGVGALELVAMDMKARGMYLCRTLSYEGAEFEVIEAPLEDKMMDMYKKAAEFWAELRVELLSASAFLNDKPNSSQLWRLYWASHQRFFRHICMSAKVPAAVRLAKQALVEEKSVVIGLQSTGEARTEEAVTKYGSELDDFVSGPRELLLKFVEENYPLPEKPELLPGEDGVKELQRKRHSATPGVSVKGRVRKVAKWQPPSDAESDEDSESESFRNRF